MTTIVRAQILHTPRDPFVDGREALEAFSDGGLAYDAGGRILATGPFADVRAAHPGAEVVDASDAVLVPGLVDLHVHYPQIAGAMGMTLLEWLATRTLPEEARLADTAYAGEVARAFVRGLARNGTTAALVFGSHSTRTSASASSAGARSLRTTCTSPTSSSPACTPPTRASPTARRATPSWRAASSRWRATATTACASAWAATSAPARG
jgi:guanine deaminase